MSTATIMRPMHERTNDGITVSLQWDGSKVWLEVEDRRMPARSFRTTVPGDRALYAFHHPYVFEPTS